MSRMWVLGASDPEMQAIESMLIESGEQIAYATAGGQRVRPDNAYQADGCTSASALETLRASGGAIYLIECGPVDYRFDGEYVDCAAIVLRIDHHSPGDPGYGRAPTAFLAASSIGQVISELARRGLWSGGEVTCTSQAAGVAGDIERHHWASAWCVVDHTRTARTIPERLVLIAAADHCLAAAYRGECPGVDPDALMRWRAESRAAYQQRPVESLLADIKSTRAALRASRPLSLYTISVRDMRREPPWPELPEAAAREGVGYISGPLDQPDGRRKVTCSGTAEQVEAFMSSWGPSNGVVDIYGDPSRGFAGGYEDSTRLTGDAMTRYNDSGRVTIDEAMDWACVDDDYTRATVEHLFDGRDSLSAVEILDLDIPAEDRLDWVLRETLIDDATLRSFACDCAARALQHERRAGYAVDFRSWAAIEVARRYAQGEATEEELSDAAAAADAVSPSYAAAAAAACAAPDAATAAISAVENADYSAEGSHKDSEWRVARLAEILG